MTPRTHTGRRAGWPYRPLLLATLLALAATAGSAGQGTLLKVDATAQQRIALREATVEQRSFVAGLRVIGQVVRAPGATTTVKTLLGGRVEQLLVAPGDEVRSGQPLLVLHSHQLHDLEGSLLRADERLRRAENRLAAGRQLLEVDGISRLEVEQREEEVLNAKVGRMQAEAELHALGYGERDFEQLLERQEFRGLYTLRAPDAGTVLEVTVQQHAWVEGLEPLLTLGDPRRVELALQLPPDQVARIQPGDRVHFYPVGRPQAHGQGTILSRVPQVDPTTRTVTLRAEIETGQELFPGVFVEGEVEPRSEQLLLAVPESAVARSAGTDYVFVRRGDTTFEARAVRLGPVVGGHYAVLEGLSAGEQVVVDGVFLLKSMLVRGEG